MTPFKISTSGDYVQLIYVDSISESVQQELKSDTDAFECSYDSDGKLFMQFGAMRFENPDPTDFTINGSQVTDAADFISKLNALFTGGGGGGGSSFLPTTGTGTATGDITGDLDGHSLTVLQGGQPFLILGSSASDEQIASLRSSDGIGSSYTTWYSNSIDGYAFENTAGDGVNEVEIRGDAVAQTITYVAANGHIFNGLVNLPTQAAPGSPNDGDIWREDNTNTGLKIRINGVTKTIVVS